jgi:hypothetical protein
MQSSTAIAFRALIMLIFLICVPLVAIFGRDLPEVVKGLLDGRLSVQVTEQPKASATTPAAPSPAALQNNPFAETAPYRAAQSPAAMTPPAANPLTPTTNSVVPAAGFPTAGPSTAMPAAGFIPPAGVTMPSPTAINVPAAAQGNPADWPSPTAAQVPPDAFPVPQDARPAAPLEPARPNESQSAGGTDSRFRQIETRLRELGAANYRLETWGAQNDHYRFECRMAVGGNIGVTQHFEAVEDDPVRSMESVLRQVEDWQRQAAM